MGRRGFIFSISHRNSFDNAFTHGGSVRSFNRWIVNPCARAFANGRPRRIPLFANWLFLASARPSYYLWAGTLRVRPHAIRVVLPFLKMQLSFSVSPHKNCQTGAIEKRDTLIPSDADLQLSRKPSQEEKEGCTLVVKNVIPISSWKDARSSVGPFWLFHSQHEGSRLMIIPPYVRVSHCESSLTETPFMLSATKIVILS